MQMYGISITIVSKNKTNIQNYMKKKNFISYKLILKGIQDLKVEGQGRQKSPDKYPENIQTTRRWAYNQFCSVLQGTYLTMIATWFPQRGREASSPGPDQGSGLAQQLCSQATPDLNLVIRHVIKQGYIFWPARKIVPAPPPL